MFRDLKTVLEIFATVLTVVSFAMISAGVFVGGFLMAGISQIIWIIWANMGGRIWGIIVVNGFLFLASVNGFIGAI